MFRVHKMSSPRPLAQTLFAALMILASVTLTGCLEVSADIDWGGGDVVSEQTRSFSESFPAGSEVRLANLAGTVELRQGGGSEVSIEATVHAAAETAEETRELLDGLRWVKERDVLGEAGYALSYPVGDYKGFHYPRDRKHRSNWLGGHGSTTVRYMGRKVRVTDRARPSSPTLYADLVITVPAGTTFALANSAGAVRGGDLAGSYLIDTGSGSVTLGRVDGPLNVDTGSGHVEIASVRGNLNVDTGSGGVEIGELWGNGLIDTGSGHVEIDRVDSDSLEIDTGSGGIEIRNGRVDRLSADTGSGHVEVAEVDVVTVEADTGSGGVEIVSSLDRAESIVVDTGSGHVAIIGGPNAEFDLDTSLGSGSVNIGYDDAELIRNGREVVGARRGSGRTKIDVDTGSGGCTVRPAR